MAKRFPAFLVLLLILIFLAACGGTDGTTTSETEHAAAGPSGDQPTPEPTATEATEVKEATEEEKVGEAEPEQQAETETAPKSVNDEADGLAEIDPSGQSVTFWHSYSDEREAQLREMVEAFNDKNRYGITVIARNRGSSRDIHDNMITGIAEGQVPELVVAHQSQAADYHVAGGLVDLTPYIESPTYGLSAEDREDFFATFVASDYNQRYEVQLGFPSNRSMEVMYYNIDMLNELGYDEPPASWETFQEMACAAAEAGYMGYQLSTNASRFTSMLFSRDGRMMTADFSGYTLDSAEAVETMTFLQTLFEQECATLVRETHGDQANFGAGDLLFTIASSSGLPLYADAVSEGYGGDWSIAPLPHTTPEPVQAIYGPSLSIPRTTPEQQLAAWLFLKWFTQPAQQASWTRAANTLPVRKSVAKQLDDYFAANPRFATAFDLLPHGRAEPPVGGYNFVRALLAEAMVEIVLGGDAAQTLADVNAEANALLENFASR